MALDPETKKRLDDGAALARAEFERDWQTQGWTAIDVARWWVRWCTMQGTNHDRLGRILMEVTGVRITSTGVELTPDEARDLAI